MPFLLKPIGLNYHCTSLSLFAYNYGCVEGIELICILSIVLYYECVIILRSLEEQFTVGTF